MNFRRRAAAVSASLILGVSGAALVGAPAQAATYIDVCNSAYSDSYITAYSLTSGYSTTVAPDHCAYNLYNADNQIRVNVNTNGSYKHTAPGAGWNVPCYDAPKTNSNPSGDRRWYRTWSNNGC